MTPEQSQIFLKAVSDMLSLEDQLKEARAKNLQITATTLVGLVIGAEGKVDRMVASLQEEAASKEQLKMF